ncbi:hypothetical protein [Salinicola halimionae]|uniref:hypothetical protein n=1 Tax=Salinicola halimionae TaxID=1949081 RepID=UPI001300A846|nr:hypothetical protein [Salinicola halimionae]
MTSPHQLERLMQLRRQRTRLAEEALATGQRQCRDLTAQYQALEQSLVEHQRSANQREQAQFDSSQSRLLNAEALADWQQTMADDAAHRETLLHERRAQMRHLKLAEEERDAQATEWARRLRAQRALERLQTDRQRAMAVNAERLTELEIEEARQGRGDLT